MASNANKYISKDQQAHNYYVNPFKKSTIYSTTQIGLKLFFELFLI